MKVKAYSLITLLLLLLILFIVLRNKPVDEEQLIRDLESEVQVLVDSAAIKLGEIKSKKAIPILLDKYTKIPYYKAQDDPITKALSMYGKDVFMDALKKYTYLEVEGTRGDGISLGIIIKNCGINSYEIFHLIINEKNDMKIINLGLILCISMSMKLNDDQIKKLEILMSYADEPTKKTALKLLSEEKKTVRKIQESEKAEKIRNLLSEANAKDNPGNPDIVLTLIDEILRLSPGHAEAIALKEKLLRSIKAGDVITNSLGMKFAYIPPGEFEMGSPPEEEGHDGAETLHRVRLTKGYFLGVMEVTQGVWERVMGNNPSYFKGEQRLLGNNPREFKKDPSLPVEQVTWEDAKSFCAKLSQTEGKLYRLPTEAEWEYACRAGSKGMFCFGNLVEQLGEYAWYRENSVTKTHPVGMKKPNGWGLYDMHGNVWEWCEDWYGEYPEGSVTDPKGPKLGQYRVLRGGSWLLKPKRCRSAYRIKSESGFRDMDYGFRLLIDL